MKDYVTPDFFPGDLISARCYIPLWSEPVPTHKEGFGTCTGHLNKGEFSLVIQKITRPNPRMHPEKDDVCMLILSSRGEIGYWYVNLFAKVSDGKTITGT